MSEIGKFIFSNGKSIDIKEIEHNIYKNGTLLNKYDKDNNSVFDSDELAEIQKDLQEGKLNKEEEISLYASITGLSVEKSKVDFENSDSNANNINIQEKEVREIVLQRFQNDTDNAFEIFKKSLEDAGVGSKLYNNIKNLLNTEYSGQNIVKELYKEQVSSELLTLANDNNGLSVEIYIQTKINLLNSLLKANGLSDDERQNIADSVRFMDLEQLNSTIISFIETNSENSHKLVKKIYENSIKNNTQIMDKTSDRSQNMFIQNPKPDSIETLLKSRQTQEKLSFDKIYELERGVKFNTDNIQKYENNEKQLNRFLGANNFVVDINNQLENPVKNLENLNRYSGTPEELEKAYDKLNNSILSVLKNMYGDDEQSIEEAIKKYGGDSAKIEKGALDFGAKGINYNAIVNMAHNIQNDLKTNLNKMLKGKSIEELQQNLENDYQAAYGRSATLLAQEFQRSQEKGIEYIKMGTTAVGLVTAIASSGTIVPVVGITIATVGPSATSYIEGKTKTGGLTTEDKANLKEELKMAGLFTVAGFGVGSVSAQIGKELLKKCPKLVAYFTQYGSDAIMMTLTDYAIMGEINLTNEGIGELMNILSGIVAHHKINSHSNSNTQFKPYQTITNDNARHIQKSVQETIKPTIKNDKLADNIPSETTSNELTHKKSKYEKPEIKEYKISTSDDIAASHPLDIKKGVMAKKVTYDLNVDKFPSLKLPNGQVIDLNNPEYSKQLLALKEGQQLTIGREGDILISDNTGKVSRKHLIIYKQNGKLRIVDQSSNGTIVYSDGENIPHIKLTKGIINKNIPYEIKISNLPTLKISDIKINLSQYKHIIEALQEGQLLTIGRDGDIKINSPYVSSIHLVIYKRNGKIHIKDVSSNVTEVVSKHYKISENQNVVSLNSKLTKLYSKITEAIDNLSTEKQFNKILKSIEKHFSEIEDIFIELFTKLETKAKQIGLNIENILLNKKNFKNIKNELSDIQPINQQIVKNVANKHHCPILNCDSGTKMFKKGNKFVVDLATNKNTQISLGPIVSVDLNEPRLAYLLKNLKEGDSFTIGSFDGKATYRLGSSSNGVSHQHLKVTKENGVLIFEDTSTYGTLARLNKAKPISAKEVKKMFNNDYIKSSYYIAKVHHSNMQLSASDYKNIAALMNKCNGRYRSLWESTCIIDNGRNIDKLAAFAKLIQKHGSLNYYLNLDDKTWDVIVNNICQKQQNAVDAIYNYKCSSANINHALSSHTTDKLTRTYINEMTDYLNTQTINKNIKAYRGEQYNGALNLVKLPNGMTLGQAMENLISKGASQQEINYFVNKYMVGNAIKQERFMSTSLNKSFCADWAKNNKMGHSGANSNGSIVWEIDIPGETRGAFVEDFNIPYGEEYEIILQRESYLIIKGAYFDKHKKQWIIQATVKQPPYEKIPRY